MNPTVPSWSPTPHEGGASIYARAIQRHWALIVVVTIAALLASLVWLAVRSPEYEATAQVLVAPLSTDSQTLIGLPILRDSGSDPSRVLETAATLLRSPQAASETARQMGADWDAKRVQDSVEVTPESQSSILEMVGSSDEAEEAAKLANVYTRAALDARAAALQDLVESALDRLRARASVTQSDAAASDLASRIGELEAVREGGDPTLSLARTASVPTSRAGAGGPVIVALSLIAGLTLGVVAALLLEMLNRRVRGEDEAVELYDIPVLARVPSLPSRAGQPGRSIAAGVLPSAYLEAFRIVLAQLTANSDRGARRIMVTSGSTGDGKTSSAIALATAFARAGYRALLIDLDTRKPGVAQVLGVKGEPLNSLTKVDAGGFGHLFRPVPGMSTLSVLATAESGRLGPVETLHERVPLLLAEAREAADFVVIDTPPLGEFSDALRIAHEVEDVIVVVRPRRTDRRGFEVMRDLLNRTGNVPVGMLVVGETQSGRLEGYRSNSWPQTSRSRLIRMRR